MNFSKRSYALISGISLLIMALAAGFAYGYVHNGLVVPGDALATLANIKTNPRMFGSGVSAWMLIVLSDLVVALCLYRYFTSVNLKIAIATGFVRAVYSVILALAVYQLGAAWNMLRSGNLDAVTLVHFIENFETYWSHGLILFGGHLLGLGYLSFKSDSLPKWIAYLLFLAGIGYALINGAKAVTAGAADAIAVVEMAMALPMTLAELSLAIWLVWKGGKQTNDINRI